MHVVGQLCFAADLLIGQIIMCKGKQLAADNRGRCGAVSEGYIRDKVEIVPLACEDDLEF